MIIESSVFNFFMYAFISLFVIINPFSTASIFLTLTEDSKKEEKKEIIKGATVISTIILMVFAVTGLYIFKFFGISIGAFKIAGGIILMKISLELLKGEHRKLHHSHFEVDDIVIVPLSIPLIAGPGTISTVVVMISDNPGFNHYFLIFLAILLNMLLIYFVLSKSEAVQSFFKERGLRVINKIMGIILTALSVQFFINGIKDILPLMF